MRGMQAALDGNLFPQGQLLVAVNVRPSAEFLYAFATALVLICIIWIGVTVILSAWAVRRSLAPIRLLSARAAARSADEPSRSAEHTSELQSLMRISYAVFYLKKTLY